MANKAKGANKLNKRIHTVARKLYENQFKVEREKQKANPDSYEPPEHFFSFYEYLDALNAKYSLKALKSAKNASEVRTNNDRRQKQPKKRRSIFARRSHA